MFKEVLEVIKEVNSFSYLSLFKFRVFLRFREIPRKAGKEKGGGKEHVDDV